MKKLLALVLALVMTLGLATVSSSAAYTDQDDINYEEAVAVMTAIGVFEGKGDKFDPSAALNRAEAAKVVTYLMVGNKTAEAMQGTGTKYTDVPASHWAAGYIEYLTAVGVVSGKGNGLYGPNDPLTTTQFAKMLLVALGYDAKIENFVGGDWAINVQKVANQVGLFSGNSDVKADATVIRDEAALYSFNAIKTPLVEYDSKVSVNVNGADVTVGNSNAKYVTSVDNTGRYSNIANLKDNTNRQANIVEFAEEYYPKLVRELDDTDPFGRPAHVWTYDKKEIGTYVDTTLLVDSFTTAKSGKYVYDVLGKSIVENFETTVYVDGRDVTTNALLGDIEKKNEDDWGSTGTGILTEIYVDKDKEETTIVLVNTYLALATTDYNAKSESATIRAYYVTYNAAKEYVRTNGATATVKVAKEDFAAIKDAATDDAFLVTFAQGELQSLVKAEMVEEAVVSGFATTKGSITVDGTKYSKAANTQYDAEVLSAWTGVNGTVNLKDSTYDIYLDAYGNVIGAALHEGVTNYAFVTGVEAAGYSALANLTGVANLLFTDGTSATVKYNPSKSTGIYNADGTPTTLADNMINLHNAIADTKAGVDAENAQTNTWVTYTVDKNGVYTLKQVPVVMPAKGGKLAQYVTTLGEINIDSKHVSLAGNTADQFVKVYGNNDTVYMTAKLGHVVGDQDQLVVISGVSSVTTGVANASLRTYETAAEQKIAAKAANAAAEIKNEVFTLYNNNGYVVAAVVLGKDSSVSKNLVYVKGGVSFESYDKTTEEWTWTRDVFCEGEVVTLKERGTALDILKPFDAQTDLDGMKSGAWYEIGYDADGYVITKTEVAPNAFSTISDPVAYATAPTFNADGEGHKNIADIIGDRDVDTLIYQEAGRTKLPTLKGQTLYIDTTNDQGFRVAQDVKIALYQETNNDGGSWKYYDGISQLESVFETLNPTATQNGVATAWLYALNAKIDDGVAKFIIIVDGTDDGWTRRTVTANPYYTVAYAANNALTVTYTGAGNGDKVDAVNAIVAKLTADGYNDVAVKYAQPNYVVTATKRVNDNFTQTFEFTWNGNFSQGT